MENTFEFHEGDTVYLTPQKHLLGRQFTIKNPTPNEYGDVYISGPFNRQDDQIVEAWVPVDDIVLHPPVKEYPEVISGGKPVFAVGDSVTYNGITDRYFIVIKLGQNVKTALIEGYHGDINAGLSSIWLPCHELTHIRDLPYITAHQRPPKGLTPRFLIDEKRLQEIDDAVSRYVDAQIQIPLEWITERNELLARLGNAKKQSLVRFSKVFGKGHDGQGSTVCGRIL